MYCRRRYAAAPSWTARAISCIRSLPAGCFSSHQREVEPEPDRDARADEREGNRVVIEEIHQASV